MELDYPTIKALSSPTRIKVLHQLLEKEHTPTQLSEDLGKSKSTVSSHLSVLQDADLVEKDEEEGRRRVTYTPTRKAKAIVEGRERTVKFSVASSVLTGVAGVALLGSKAPIFGQPQSTYTDRKSGGDAGAMGTMDAPTAEATEAAPSKGGDGSAGTDTVLDQVEQFVPPELLTPEAAAGAVLLVVTAVLLFYTYQLHQLDQ